MDDTIAKKMIDSPEYILPPPHKDGWSVEDLEKIREKFKTWHERMKTLGWKCPRV